jgi:hypothetical protein
LRPSTSRSPKEDVLATIYPGSLPARAVARVLLDIVGPGREHEVRSGTGPERFEVPEDVGVEYERRLRAAAEQPPEGPGLEPAPELETTPRRGRPKRAAGAEGKK